MDDSYITYQYVKQFLNTGNFDFNGNSEWVEGFSSPLWLLLLTLLAKLFGVNNTPLISMILGIVFLILSIILSYKVAGQIQKSKNPPNQTYSHYFKLLLTLIIAVIPGVIFYSSTGLETSFFLLAFLLALYLKHKNQPWLVTSTLRSEGSIILNILNKMDINLLTPEKLRKDYPWINYVYVSTRQLKGNFEYTNKKQKLLASLLTSDKVEGYKLFKKNIGKGEVYCKNF